MSKGSAPAHSLSINPANNRIAMTGYGYDANGNMTTMPLLTASYDVANRMVETQHSSAGTHRYHYNHANQRVMRYTAAVAGYGGYQRRFSLYGFAGELLLEADWMPNCVSGCPTPAEMETLRNVYFAGRKVFVSAWQGPLKAAVPNRLGSRSEHFPYGEQKGGAPPDGDRDYFTTYRRDETGLDYAWNRYYAPGVGRFTTADPYGGSVRPEDPQSWNRYEYVGEDPVNFVDPDGLSRCRIGWLRFDHPNPERGGTFPLLGWICEPDVPQPEIRYPEPPPVELPGSIDRASAAMQALRAAFEKWENCAKVLRPPASRGQSGISVNDAISNLDFVDGRSPGQMNMAGGPTLLSFEEYHSMYPSVVATTLLGPGGRPSSTIVLWHDFFGNVSGGNPTPLRDQYATLIHEFIHSVFQLANPNHSDILRKFRISVRSGEDFNQAIERWIKNDCKENSGRER